MNWVDLLVVLLALLAAASGARSGLITALFSFLGVIAGAVVGLKLAPLLLERLDSPSARIAFGVGIVVLLVAFGETFGMWAGRELRDRITSSKLTGVDNVLGAVLQCVAVFVVAWLVALPFTSASALPGLASAVTRSTVLRTVDSVMPDAAKQLPSELREMLGMSGFPEALEPFSETPVAAIDPPDPALASSEAVRDARTSVVKVRGRAVSCARALEGTGFVIAPHRVMTNAHVVAGTDKVAIEIGRGEFDAEVVLFDPNTDLAVLSVPDLDADAMTFKQGAHPGDSVIALGYPLDGPYTASPGRIRERIRLRGPDIYDSTTVVREVYTVRGKVQSGNSGGPLIDTRGDVAGVVFGAAVDDPETGFVLTADEVADEVAAAPSLHTPVSTGDCTG
ncbi:MarP family serine protease [Saccharopolyspora erythraea]|uniref:MarP family serine protease n=1 Tax=Saccharopolyspora erythraea TaxID=1836 RepID=UPI001BABE1C0|nr:MarP family serine protease [Saccharopolyspora erythraea]QUG99689.1 MarP family serine protease [Saccharopolyspora erythraea]